MPSSPQTTAAPHVHIPKATVPTLTQPSATPSSKLINDNRKLAQSTILLFKRYITNQAQFCIKRKESALPVMTLMSGYWLSERVTALLSRSNASRSSFLTAAEPHRRYRPTTCNHKQQTHISHFPAPGTLSRHHLLPLLGSPTKRTVCKYTLREHKQCKPLTSNGNVQYQTLHKRYSWDC